MHEFIQPGKSYIVSNLDRDSRLFVFLRQQLDSNRNYLKLDELLTDTLILFGLEGTDPDKGIFKTADELKDEINKYIKFDLKILNYTIDRRLRVLSEKPRKIKYHSKENAYCLPYETRLEICNRNIEDQQLFENFYKQTELNIKKFLKNSDTTVKNLTELINETIHKIFYQQGLEFSNFILHGDSKQVIEKDLEEVISRVVDESSVVNKNKEAVKTSLLMAIRDIVYNGTPDQKKYLWSLSNTYMMMFLLQWDPQIATYFESMASRLEIFVCTSIIIPALSEYYLEPENRRHWNLLVGAKNAGIKLYINETIINELAFHFQMITHKYNTYFKDGEKAYLDNELEVLYIDEILIRAYFYTKMKRKVHNFEDFIDAFLDPDLKTAKEDLKQFLKDEFGISYISEASLGVKIDEEEKDRLYEKLKEKKSHHVKAERDSSLILTIYKLREKGNESDSSSIFGYKTWWLSKDTTTYKCVNDVFKDQYPVSCYMRPDFLYNYITLAPKKSEVDSAYKEIFPSLLGVNLSFHLPKEITSFVQERIAEHKTKKNPARLRSILRRLSEKLKSDPLVRNKEFVKHFWDDELKKLEEQKIC